MADVFRLLSTTLTTTGTTTILSMDSSSTAIIRGIIMCNSHTSSSATYDLTVVPDGITTGRYIFRGVSVASQATSQPLNDPLVLSAGCKLQAKPSAAGQFDATVSYLESY